MAQIPHAVKLARPGISTERFLACCEDFYKRDGFVKWADVARALGISRQGVQHRVTKLRESGELDDATFERYQSMSSRRSAARRNRELSRDLEQRTPRLQFTPENFAWLRKECELRQVTIADIVNGLVNKAREDE